MTSLLLKVDAVLDSPRVREMSISNMSSESVSVFSKRFSRISNILTKIVTAKYFPAKSILIKNHPSVGQNRRYNETADKNV